MQNRGGDRPKRRIGPTNGDEDDRAGSDQHLSTQGLVIVFAALAVALVLGYLLVNKLADMSQEEDCALGRRYNCAAVEVPR
jgi:hypothetical protein